MQAQLPTRCVGKAAPQQDPGHRPCYQLAHHTIWELSVPQADAPNFAQIPEDEVTGVTVILLTCSYKSQVRRRGVRSFSFSRSLCYM